METTNEFQKQSEINKKLQRALSEALGEKERHYKPESEPKVISHKLFSLSLSLQFFKLS